jgi:hypothetical protein
LGITHLRAKDPGMSSLWLRSFVALSGIFGIVSFSLGADPPLVATDLKQVDRDYWFQGEYLGATRSACGRCESCGLQVVALGKSDFQAVLYQGGLPGGGWWTGMAKQEFKGKRDGESLLLVSADAAQRIEISKSTATVQTVHRPPSPASEQVNAIGQLMRVERRSQTLGAAPPCGAIVLFDGKNTDHWKKGRMTDDGLLMIGTETIVPFQDFYMHVEFQLPYMPNARGQGRANSGVYIQSRYEVQVLDSFGLKGENNEAAALYKFKAPDVNLCFPPLVWQTYDIEFQAARFNADKQKTSPATISVWHNGVLVQNRVELANKTGGGAQEGPQSLPTKLQDHGNPVRFRNIWLIDRSGSASNPQVALTAK